MKNTIQQLEQIINTYSEQLKKLNEKNYSEKIQASVWSKKEELGHLIDSAHNNLRRFIVTQYEDQPKIVYDQNFWNKAANYQQQSSTELIDLWILLNKQIGYVLDAMPVTMHEKICDTKKDEKELHTIHWLVEDYKKHLLHHLHHLLGLETIRY